MLTEPDRRLVVGPGATALRHRLDPTAWVVLEELLLASTGPTDACTASVSVRVLAARLGLAKDTVARALVRLRATGLVIATHQARATGGAFATGAYRLAVPTDVLSLVTDVSDPGTRVTARSKIPTGRRHTEDATQLSLLAP